MTTSLGRQSLLTQSSLSDIEYAADSPGSNKGVSVLSNCSSDSMDFATLLQEVSQPMSVTADHIRAVLSESGAVLLRDLPISNTSQAEQLLSALGTDFDDEYLGGASPRSRLSDHFFTSTEAPAPYVISFHTEMCYLRQRPGKIFFYCITPPTEYGETPVFDCAQILANLSPQLHDKVSKLGMLYQRYFVAKPVRFFNVYKTWMDAFGATTKKEVELACEQQGMKYEWQADGSLLTQSSMPGVIEHPVSGAQCLSLTLYNGTAAPYDMRTFAHRFNPIKRFALDAFIRSQYVKKNVFMRTLWGDGSAISGAETRAILDAAWQASTLFKWHKGDLLMLDNMCTGHGRLNVTKPRMIAAALGDPYSL